MCHSDNARVKCASRASGSAVAGLDSSNNPLTYESWARIIGIQYSTVPIGE